MEKSQEELLEMAKLFRINNYYYTYMKAMLEKGKTMKGNNLALVTGSSHALNGIDSTILSSTVNCSMHSQDLYYDFLCAREILDNVQTQRYKKCFIVLGYYNAYNDLSKGEKAREWIVTKVYYPIFGDAHNWSEPYAEELWRDFVEVELSEEERAICEKRAIRFSMESQYYNEIVHRKPFFDFAGRQWSDLMPEEREEFGRKRAEGHNKSFKFKDCFEENAEILKDYVRYLELKQIKPIVMITPYSKEYNHFINPEMKAGISELIAKTQRKIEYMDFNERYFDEFNESHFTDMDHLNEEGAKRLSCLLWNLCF